MTKINLLTQGQQLINASKVVVASGDVNSVQLCVEFDSAAWGEYPARSATFYTSKDATVHEMLLLNDKCIVPFEVLTEACVLFIGVRGVSADGERVKTSSLVKYKVSEGAPIGDKTLTPTMDLYQQYLAALKAEADPVIAAVRTEIQAAAEASILEVEEAAKELTSTVLWTNPDTSSAFAAQTVAFDASQYKTFRVIFGNTEQTISEKGKTYTVLTPSASTQNIRNVKITDTGAEFSDESSSGTANNKRVIPEKILGYKY